MTFLSMHFVDWMPLKVGNWLYYRSVKLLRLGYVSLER